MRENALGGQDSLSHRDDQGTPFSSQLLLHTRGYPIGNTGRRRNVRRPKAPAVQRFLLCHRARHLQVQTAPPTGKLLIE